MNETKNYNTKYSGLLENLKKMGAVLVAYSGGLDSTFLLASSITALGRDRVLAVTARSAIRPSYELEEAARIVRELDCRWLVIDSLELQNQAFLANTKDRCYHCKLGLAAILAPIAESKGAVIVEGTNASDALDSRPGFRAVLEEGIRSPLLEIGISKEDIRRIVEEKGLPSPRHGAEACLCTRIPFGEMITVEKLARISRAESVVRQVAGGTVRVRDHGEIARLEVDPGDLEVILDPRNRSLLIDGVRETGYKYVTLDLAGYRQGSMG